MKNDDNIKDKQDSVQESHHPLLLSLLGGAGFILLLVIITYLAGRVETLEDRLSYNSPVTMDKPTVGIDLASSQTVYVPVYSHIYSGGGMPVLLASTLSVRNSDPDRSIHITKVRYYDTKGKLIKDYLDGGLALGPLESTAFLVEKSHVEGGSGANFIVDWYSDQAVYEPVIEAVMVGLDNNQGIAFKSIGRPLIQRNDPVSTR